MVTVILDICLLMGLMAAVVYFWKHYKKVDDVIALAPALKPYIQSLSGLVNQISSGGLNSST